ncbi:hypothetical protein [Streptomyces sp. ST2-7A]|uniref:hypothetical protein n=1 Tax=Streptomyces sp. ST2-7A TaxID=2907214 RepID=UPI001F485CFF|nr:hypothetical protein [Streptomyces sp. ST2-7A]MCE7083207.1 hypothetical protein [Streptomyces sp. ST2-7A]
MRHLMRAETRERPGTDRGTGSGATRSDATGNDATGTVKTWHMVRGAETLAMCGRQLAADSVTRSDEDWGRTEEPMCHTCGALYLREVP